MNRKVLCIAGLLLLTGCGNSETPTTTAATATEIVTTAEQKTEATTAEATTAATAVKQTLSDREAKNKDAYTAGALSAIFDYTLADEEGFDEFYPMIEQGGFVVQPFPDGTYTFIFPDGAKSSKIESIFTEQLKNIDVSFNYFPSDYEPLAWFFNVDEDFKTHIWIYTSTEEYIEIYPNIDKRYK